VDAPGEVMVEYWSEGTDHLITEPVHTEGSSFSLQLMRLRADTQYHFNVFLSESPDNPVIQYYHRSTARRTAKCQI